MGNEYSLEIVRSVYDIYRSVTQYSLSKWDMLILSSIYCSINTLYVKDNNIINYLNIVY